MPYGTVTTDQHRNENSQKNTGELNSAPHEGIIHHVQVELTWNVSIVHYGNINVIDPINGIMK